MLIARNLEGQKTPDDRYEWSENWGANGKRRGIGQARASGDRMRAQLTRFSRIVTHAAHRQHRRCTASWAIDDCQPALVEYRHEAARRHEPHRKGDCKQCRPEKANWNQRCSYAKHYGPLTDSRLAVSTSVASHKEFMKPPRHISFRVISNNH